jgi:hypothetical protein
VSECQDTQPWVVAKLAAGPFELRLQLQQTHVKPFASLARNINLTWRGLRYRDLALLDAVVQLLVQGNIPERAVRAFHPDAIRVRLGQIVGIDARRFGMGGRVIGQLCVELGRAAGRRGEFQPERSSQIWGPSVRRCTSTDGVGGQFRWTHDVLRRWKLSVHRCDRANGRSEYE